MKFRYSKRFIVEEADACYHVITRTIGDEYLFDDREKEVFRRMLWKQAAFAGVEVLTYAVMSNHVHLLLRVPYVSDAALTDDVLIRRYDALYGDYVPPGAHTPKEMVALLHKNDARAERIRSQLKARMGDLAVFMQELKRRFTRWYHHANGGHGTIWAEKYKALLVEDEPEVLSVVAAYIDLNPVRAQLADEPAGYRFCGYAEALGGNQSARKGLMYVANGSDWDEAQARYRLWIYEKGCAEKGGSEDKDRGTIPDELANEVEAKKGQFTRAEAIRYRIRYFQDGVALGSESFVEALFNSARGRFGSKRKTGARRLKLLRSEDSLRVLRDLQC